MRGRNSTIAAKAAVAVLASIGVTELVGISGVVSRFVQVDFIGLEVVLGITLWLLLVIFLLLRARKSETRFLELTAVGFVAGIVSGLIGVVCLSILHYPQRGVFNSGLSWTDLTLLLATSMLATFGWLNGLFAAMLIYFITRPKPPAAATR